jgi:hypothetical protein
MRRSPRRLRGGLLLLLALALTAGTVPAGGLEEDPEEDATWTAFVADRDALLEALAPPILECFQRRDSLIDPLSPIFHGCLDWHSAVHAAYSHYAISRRTGISGPAGIAEDKIAPLGVSLVPLEHRYLQAKGLDLPLTENPYGFGWFLVLAAERERAGHGTDLREMADDAAQQMSRWFQERLDRRDARTYITNPNHANYSWSLLNLDTWARHTGDEALGEAVRRFSAPLFAGGLDSSCPAERDTATDQIGFQPVCLMRLAAAAQIWGPSVADWVDARLPDDLHVPPVTEPANCHAGGQNFTKAFALQRLHQVTGDTGYRDNAIELIRYHVGRPDLYIDPSYVGDPGYLCYSHWVAQLGVRAISLSYEDPPDAPDGTPPL